MTTIKLRRGTAAEWDSADPVLALGEPGIATDTGMLKVGDGSTEWSGLPPVLDGAYAPRRSVSVLEYGADSSGESDSTAAFHAARNSGAKEVEVPKGDYLTNGVNLNVEGQVWSFHPDARLIHSDMASTDLLTISQPSVRVAGGILIGNRQYNQANSVETRRHGLVVSARDAEIDDLTIVDAGKSGVYVYGDSSGLSIPKVTVIDSLETGLHVQCTSGHIDNISLGNVLVRRELGGDPGNKLDSPSDYAHRWSGGGVKFHGTPDSTYKVRYATIDSINASIPQDDTAIYSNNGTEPPRVCRRLSNL